MDSTFVGNAQAVSGLSEAERYSAQAHWIGAGAQLVTGSDLTRLDALGRELLGGAEALALAGITAQFPMQPRNPAQPAQPHSHSALGHANASQLGGAAATQLQAWIAGPDPAGVAVVVLANYGPDPCLRALNKCRPTYATAWAGVQNVSIPLAALGIGPGAGGPAPPRGSRGAAWAGWAVRRVWGGGGAGGADHSDVGTWTDRAESMLGPGESALYKFTRV
jgi:alpha-galactosidase